MAPTPLPLESGGNATALEAVGGMGGQMGTISLGMLIQYINQRTYSDLLNLAEILPRKSDLEKKLDIVRFAQRTRQLYVRLLALVKWAASASKVEKCCHITGFLDKQNSLFIDTADKLYQMTKENLVNARLPHFHIPAAVETLTTGSYDRLPLTIRQRILPPEPTTSLERRDTLSRLEQIVLHRLVHTDLPPQMRTCKVENGRVWFTVENEFEVSLTLMGDSVSEPWRLLEIDILVEDKETGEGKALVHPLQVGYIHQLLQSRLQDNPNPLMEVYTILHSFCQSLQLEVLYAQTLKLLEDRLDYHIRVEEYLQGKSLTLTYWRELTHKDSGGQFGYRLTIQVDIMDHSKPLLLLHTPSLSTKESEIAERAIRSDHLSIERLLVHTIYLRTKSRLSDLKQEMDSLLGCDAEKCSMSGSPAILHVPLVQPCLPSEQLLITVDTHTGLLLCHIPQYDTCPRMADLQNCLNHDRTKLEELLSELRYWIMVRRTDKTLQHLPASSHERLPLMYDSSHPLASLSKHKVFVTFHRRPNYIMIIEFSERPGNVCDMDMTFYLLMVKEASIEDDPNDDTVRTSLPKSYLRAYRLMPLDPFVCTHGPSTKIEIMEPSDRALGRKRKLAQKADTPSKRVKLPAYFLPEVAQVVAMCDQMFPLALLAHEFHQNGVHSSGILVEEAGLGVVLRLTDLPSTKDLSPQTVDVLQKHVLSISIRTTVHLRFLAPQNSKGSKMYVVKYLFTNCPVQTHSSREQGIRRPVTFTYETPLPEEIGTTVQAIVADWVAMAKLYELVLTFAEVYKLSSDPNSNLTGGLLSLGNPSSNLKFLSEMVRVKSYNYRSITLSYGSNFDAYAIIKYNTERQLFNLSFGVTGSGSWASNAHTMLASQLQEVLNDRKEYGLVSLSYLLHNTYQPLQDLSKLRTTCTVQPGTYHPVQIFTVVPQSATRLRVFYHNTYCLEVDLLSSGLVSIRDGAFSLFNTSRLIEKFIPIKGLKTFLSKYVDETAISRRRSQSEDDNPPTPMTQEDITVGWPAPTKPSSPARHGPITPPVSSNPHTPASPHPGSGSHGGFNPSPAGAFSLASPPSLPSMNPSPSGGYLGGNSPSASVHSVSSPGMLPVQSPVGHSLLMHSPASSYLSTAHMPQQSRMLPNRTYAAAIPTLLTHDDFHTLCYPPQVEDVQDNSGPCILEQFLGSISLHRYLLDCVRNNDAVLQVKNEPGLLQVKLESLVASFSLKSIPIHALALKLQPAPEYADRWTAEELQAVEMLFCSKVSSPPYKQQAMDAFFNLLKFPHKILKDCVRLIQIEMMLTPQQQLQLKWSLQWCLTVPAIGYTIIPPGRCAIINSRNKWIFVIQLTRIQLSMGHPLDMEPPILILPIVYDNTTKKTQLAKRDTTMADLTVRSIQEFLARSNVQHHDCTIYPCIRDLLMNLVLSSEGPTYTGSPVTLGTQQGQGGPGMGSVSQSMASPLMTSPVQTSLAMHTGQGVVTSGGVGVNPGGQGPAHYVGPGSHMGQGAGMSMASMQGGMGGMGHAGMGGGMMQDPRGLQMGGMQPGTQGGFGGPMMGGQFTR